MNQNYKSKPKHIKYIEKFLFGARWILIPFYVILFLSLIVYALVDIKEFIHYIEKFSILSKETATLTVIEMIDLAMIAALGKMIITGGYNSFVSKEHGYKDENFGSGLLKVKMATSLIGVTSIALLSQSINISIVGGKSIPMEDLYKLAIIHALFLIGAVVLSYVDRIHFKNEIETEELKMKHNKKEINLEDGK